jgi:hypothetical protein
MCTVLLPPGGNPIAVKYISIIIKTRRGWMAVRWIPYLFESPKGKKRCPRPDCRLKDNINTELRISRRGCKSDYFGLVQMRVPESREIFLFHKFVWNFWTARTTNFSSKSLFHVLAWWFNWSASLFVSWYSHENSVCVHCVRNVTTLGAHMHCEQ